MDSCELHPGLSRRFSQFEAMDANLRCPVCGHVTSHQMRHPGSNETIATCCDRCQLEIKTEVIQPNNSETWTGQCGDSGPDSLGVDLECLQSYKPGDHISWQLNTDNHEGESQSDATLNYTHEGILVDKNEEFCRLQVLGCKPELNLPSVAMEWINLADCASSLTVIEYPLQNGESIDHVLARAFHALDNDYYYDKTVDFLRYCKTGKKPTRKNKPREYPSFAVGDVPTTEPTFVPSTSVDDSVQSMDVESVSESGYNMVGMDFNESAQKMGEISIGDFGHNMDDISFEHEFNEGDHVCWAQSTDHRKHHGIIVCVGVTELTVVCMEGVKNPTIIEKKLDSRIGYIYRDETPEVIKKENPPELVVARAKEHLGPSDFKSGQDFAMFCVSGAKDNSAKSGPKEWYRTPDSSLSDLSIDSLKQPQAMALSDRTEINAYNYKGLLDGDHITWHRPWIIWHHGIVVKVYTSEFKADVIHWHKQDEQAVVCKELVDLSDERGKLYRINYPPEFMDANPPDLVLARAYSRLKETGYNILGNNCEALATYCKTGFDFSNQLCWLWMKVRQLFKSSVVDSLSALWKTPARAMIIDGVKDMVPEQVTDFLVKKSNWVSAGFVIMCEGYYCIVDIQQYHEDRKQGNMSYHTFLEETVSRISEAIKSSGLGALGSTLGGMPVGTLGSGVFVTSILGGKLGSILGKLSSQAISANVISKAIVSLVKRDDKAVKDITDLERGDQIVTYGSWLHPRCHAIVVEVNPLRLQMNVIRLLYSSGFVEEWIDFVKPVYKVTYPDGTSREPDDVIKRARSKIGTKNTYSIIMYNCKHFAEWCKDVGSKD